ncbi:MAG: hypothetical protein A2Y06_03385 [Omnitrophica WOR_2 bacterium GWA2_37_7]|nr:MAG: hypothetical protein A2Y06_03385 [Omnitrophica WOR_2 bacterium GWA2_37_7]
MDSLETKVSGNFGLLPTFIAQGLRQYGSMQPAPVPKPEQPYMVLWGTYQLPIERLRYHAEKSSHSK